MSFLKGKSEPKIEGKLKYFDLVDWWLSTFSNSEQVYIEKIYNPFGKRDKRPLTQGKVSKSNQTTLAFLTTLAGWFKKSADLHIAKRILAKAEMMKSSNVLDTHFMYQGIIQTYYKERKEQQSYLKAIDACEKQIALASRTAHAWKKQFDTSDLPAHVGFKQLAIIREKEKNYTAAIRLAKKAKKQGWNGDWDKRIERCQQKMNK